MSSKPFKKSYAIFFILYILFFSCESCAIAAVVNGTNSLSIDSDLETISNDAVSTTSQETTIVREPNEDSLKNGEVKTHKRGPSHIQRYDKLQSHEVKDVLLIFLFVVKHLAEDQMIFWWQQYSEADVVNFFTLIEMSLNCFKYIGKRHIKVVPTAVVDSAKIKPAKAHTLPARMNPPDFNHEGTGTLVIHTQNRENLVNTGKVVSCFITKVKQLTDRYMLFIFAMVVFT